MNNKTLLVIGLCARARKLAMGTNIVCDSVRDGKAKVVCLASDASGNTKKKVTNCCAYYGVQLIELDSVCQELGHAVGKRSSLSCVAILDDNLTEAVMKSINR